MERYFLSNPNALWLFSLMRSGVWGGSTSVGNNAIQLAVAAGYDVITTASPKNFGYVKKLGASQVFDYNDKAVVQKVINAFKGKTIAGALAIGRNSTNACADVVHACKGNKFISMATFPISFEKESGTFAKVSQFMAFSVAMWLKSKTRNIRTKFIFGSSLINNEVSTVIYVDFLPLALAEGHCVAAPEPYVVGKGLGQIQGGLDVQRKWVSAKKVVVSL